MTSKKIFLAGLLCFSSILLGGALGALDFFGFLGGDHGLNLTLLIAAVLFTYLTLICVILLDFSGREHYVSIFGLSSVFFGFTFFLVNLNFVLSLGLSSTFFLFLIYVFQSSSKRAAMFVRFNPSEIVGPVLKKSLMVLVIMFAALNFAQTQDRLSENNLITPGMVGIISKPFITTFNQQFSSSLQKQFATVDKDQLTPENREKIADYVIVETLKSMASQNGTIYGIDPSTIPVEKTIVYENGGVDLSPMVAAMLPDIADAINREINKYALFAPFIVALLTILLLQPFMFIVQGIEMMLTIPIFKILKKAGLIKIIKESKEVERAVL